MGEKPGEYIDLHWPDDEEGFHAVRGHVPQELAHQAISERMQEQVDDFDPAEFSEVRYLWARWCQTAFSRSENLAAELRLYSTPGRGKFPVSVILGWSHEGMRAEAPPVMQDGGGA